VQLRRSSHNTREWVVVKSASPRLQVLGGPYIGYAKLSSLRTSVPVAHWMRDAVKSDNPSLAMRR
jgi:hypothetical protein